jgi:hypothetical protein
MSALTNYGENRLLDALLRGQPLHAPETLYVALSTAKRAETGAPVEPGNGYTRVALTANLANITSTQGPAGVASSGSDGTIKNAVPVTFPESIGAWGVIQSVWIMDAPSGGNAWLSIDLVDPVNVSGNDFTLSLAPGKLSFRIDD